MIKKLIAKPFNVVYRTDNSLNKKIESIKYQIEFEKYKLQNNSIEEDRLHKLERELEYYQTIIELKDDDAYLDGIFGGEIIMIGSWVLGTAIVLGLRKFKK